MKAGEHNPTKTKFWTDHIANWRSSGLTQREYCAKQGLGLRNFVYWKRIIDSVAVGEQPLPAARHTQKHPGLIPVAIVSDLPGGSRANEQFHDTGVRLRVREYVIDLSVGFHPGTLQALLGALG